MSKNALNRFKVKKDLKKDIEKEQRGGKDNRVLPYYELKEGETMTVLLLPDTNGSLWKHYGAHGPNMKSKGMDVVECPRLVDGTDCPICQVGFDLYEKRNEARDGGDKTLEKEYAEKAKQWMPKEYNLASVVVLESPIEVPESDDGNQVKIFYMPQKIKEIISNQIQEGEIDPEDITDTPFVIKKTKNDGGYASYDSSYFRRKPISEDELAFFDDEDVVVEPLDFETIDILPEKIEEDLMEDWIDKAHKKIEKGDEKSDKKSGPTRSLRSQAKSEEGTGTEEDDNSDPEPEQEPEQEPEPEQKSGNKLTLKERLARRQQGKQD